MPIRQAIYWTPARDLPNNSFMARDGEPFWRSLLGDTTFYLSYILLVTASGPLQFGFHMVSHSWDCDLLCLT